MKDKKEFARLVALSMGTDAKLKTALILAGEAPVKKAIHSKQWVTLGDLAKKEVNK